jgi:hypothetical protein
MDDGFRGLLNDSNGLRGDPSDGAPDHTDISNPRSLKP